jgi:hypothetical protein
MSSRLGAKVVNYNEDEDDDVREEDLMPNESGELWTYGIFTSVILIAVDEPEAQDAIDAIVDHRRVAEDGTSMSPLANQDSVEPTSENVNPYTDLEYCVRFLPAKLMPGKMARTITPMELVGTARETQQAADAKAAGQLYQQKGHCGNGSARIVIYHPRRH